MVSFTTSQPLKEAVAQLSRRTPLGSAMSSAEWEDVDAELRARAFFSARVEEERLLAEMQRRIAQRVQMERSKLADGTEGAYMDRGRFIEEIRRELEKSGYRRPEGAGKESLRNLRSTRRLGLIWDMNLAQAQGYAAWVSGMNPTLLRAVPCQELVRVSPRLEHRKWPKIWEMSGGKFYGGRGSNPDYPESDGRMIALKTDPIWVAISRFQVPWPPFEWGSGMGLRNVRRREAMELGLILPNAPDQVPPETPFNANYEMSVAGVSPARRAAIVEDFLGDVEIKGDVIRLLPPPADAMGGDAADTGIISFDGVDQPAPRPDGTPITDMVKVSIGLTFRSVRAEIRRGLEILNGEIEDGVLPKIKTTLRVPFKNTAQAGGYVPVTSRKKQPELFINPKAVDAAFTVIHEAAHLIDNLGLHTPSTDRLYASEGQPEMAALMQTIRRSKAAKRLYKEVGNSALLSSRELFARAFTQYIAQRSGDEKLVETIRQIRRGERRDAGLYKNSQWTAVDFNKISRAMELLLKSLGWRRDQ